VAKYHKNPYNFSIQYDRRTINRKIVLGIEKNIVRKLKIGKDLIENREIPIIITNNIVNAYRNFNNFLIWLK